MEANLSLLSQTAQQLGGISQPAPPWDGRQISRLLAQQFFRRKCIVLVPECNWTGNEMDLLAVTMDMRIIDVEVKISRADLKADAKKEKWHTWTGWGQPKLPRDWPRKTWKHYYAMPAEIWRDDLANSLPSTKSGVLLLKWYRPCKDRLPELVVNVWRRATPCRDAPCLTAEQALDVARLANIRYWDLVAHP